MGIMFLFEVIFTQALIMMFLRFMSFLGDILVILYMDFLFGGLIWWVGLQFY